MNELLGVEITGLRRISVNDSDALMDTLMLDLSNGLSIEFIRVSQDDLSIYYISPDSQPMAPSWLEEDKNDNLIIKCIEAEGLNVPLKVESITEFWAGQEGNSYLVGLILHDNQKQCLLSLCTETDEIEVLPYTELRQRIENFPFYFGTVIAHWYESK